MKIQVFRQACCSQDDQLGPLEAVYDLSDDATIAEIVDEIVKSKFLQYSSTHASMIGEVGDVGIVRVFSPYHYPEKWPIFLVSPELLAGSVIGNGSLMFRFLLE